MTQNTKLSPKTHYNLRTFYILVLTQAFSLMGSKISGLAIGMWIFADTGNASPLLLVQFFSFLPIVFAANISGMLADRWDRRWVMMLADAGQAVGTVILLLSFTSGGFELWHLYSVTLIQAVFGMFQGPAFSASVTMLVPDEQRDRANSLQQLSGPMSGIFAPPIAGLVFSLAGVEGAIVVDLLTFIVAMIIVFSVHIPRPKATAEGLASRGSMWQEAMSGFKYLWERRTLLYMMFYLAMINFLLSGTMGLGMPYLLARTDNNEAVVGLLLSAINVGGFVGGLIFSFWGGTRPRIHTIIPGVMFAVTFMIVIGVSHQPIILGVALFLFMMPMPMVNASFASMFQIKVPPDMQGRVFAVLGQVSVVLVPLSYLIMGPLADNVFEPAVGKTGWDRVAPIVGTGAGSGMGLMLVIGGSSVLVLSVLFYSWKRIRQMEAELPDFVAEAQEATDNSNPQNISSEDDFTQVSAPIT